MGRAAHDPPGRSKSVPVTAEIEHVRRAWIRDGAGEGIVGHDGGGGAAAGLKDPGSGGGGVEAVADVHGRRTGREGHGQ